MIRKQIIASTGLDKQNQQFDLQELIRFADMLNNSDAVLRMGLNHDCSLLPIGKIISAELIARNEEILIEATIDEFIDEFVCCVGPDGEQLYLGKSSFDSRPFVEESALSETQMTVKINPIHFSKDDFIDINEYLQNQCGAKVDVTFEKALEPTVQLIFVFAAGYLVKTLLPKVKEKAAEKLSDVMSDDVVKGYELLKKSIIYVTNRIMSVGKKTYIFIEPEQPVEFIVKAKTANEVLDAISKLNDFDYLSIVEKFIHYTNDNLKKIQFIFDNIDGKWKMSYLTTKDGQVIGTEDNYKKAVIMYKKIMESPTAGFSIGGDAIIGDSEDDDNA